MGFMDNVTSAVNRGTAAAGRSADKIKINARVSEIVKRRQSLAAQLGASLYEATKDDPALRAGREALYDGIASCDAERAECERQLAALEAAAAAEAQAAATFTCAVCGARMGGGDLFCSGCGTPAEKARAASPVAAPAPAGPVCVQCGAPLGEGDLFCMSCGARVQQAVVMEGDSGIGEPEFRENAGIGESELVEVDGAGNVTITPGQEGRA